MSLIRSPLPHSSHSRHQGSRQRNASFGVVDLDLTTYVVLVSKGHAYSARDRASLYSLYCLEKLFGKSVEASGPYLSPTCGSKTGLFGPSSRLSKVPAWDYPEFPNSFSRTSTA